MKVYALVGKSGTGKSYQAINLCRDLGIESIIDDGLFIYRGKALAGKSAKRVHTKIGAVKVALFNEDDHKEAVTEKIREVKPETILLIGTSDSMVERIAKRIEVGEIDEKIYIEEITTENERKIAQKQRQGQGKHVIPVSSMQLKHEFSGYFLSPMRIFKGIGGKGDVAEKTVVRPTYSYLGEFIISDRVIGDIVSCTAESIEGVKDVIRVTAEKSIEALEISVIVNMERDARIVDIAKELQQKSVSMIEEMTAFNIKHLNIEIRGVL